MCMYASLSGIKVLPRPIKEVRIVYLGETQITKGCFSYIMKSKPCHDMLLINRQLLYGGSYSLFPLYFCRPANLVLTFGDNELMISG